jgi:hypothetical protein
MDDNLAVFEPQSDGTTLIRGHGCGTILGQFGWAIFVAAGVRIPTTKATNARAALEAAGYQVTGPGVTAQPAVGRTALPLPGCGHCAQPFPRSYTPEIGEHCTSCGHPLRLVQVDPRTESRHTPVTGHCRSCGRELTSRQLFCRCGTAVPEPERQPMQPALSEAIETVRTGWQKRRRASLPHAYTARALTTDPHEHTPDRNGFCRICQEYTGLPRTPSP